MIIDFSTIDKLIFFTKARQCEFVNDQICDIRWISTIQVVITMTLWVSAWTFLLKNSNKVEKRDDKILFKSLSSTSSCESNSNINLVDPDLIVQ